MDVKLEVRGIRELNAAFRAVDSELPKKLKGRFLAIAETVAGATRNRLPHLTGRAQSSLKAKASPRGASIAFGGSVAPYEPWLDFGGKVGRGKRIVREMVSGGRYLYPTIAEHSDDISKQAEDAINDTARDAGFETKGF